MRLPRPHPFFPPHQVASSAMSSSRYLSTPPARRTAATPNHHPPSPPTTSALRRVTPAGMPRPPHRENTRAGKDRHLLPKRDSRALNGPFRCNRPIAGTALNIDQSPGDRTPASMGTVRLRLQQRHIRSTLTNGPASSLMSCPPRPAPVSVVHQPLQHPWQATFTPLQLGRAPVGSEAFSYTRASASPCHDPPWIKFDQNRQVRPSASFLSRKRPRGDSCRKGTNVHVDIMN